jgi:type I restriction enzyme S subunit
MGEWKEVILKNLATIQQGYAFKSEDFNDKKGVPVIKIKNISSGKVDLNETQFFSKDITSLARYYASMGDILIAMTGSHLDQLSSVVGRVSKYNYDFFSLLNQRTAKIIPNESIANKTFIYYSLILDETLHLLASNASGSANQANISSEQIYNLPILLPPLPEQESIAEVLSSLDDKIDLLHRNNKTLEQLAETLFRQWFIEDIENNCIPGRVKDICKLPSGFSFKSNSFIENGIYKIITIKNVQNGYLDFKNTDIHIIDNGSQSLNHLEENVQIYVHKQTENIGVAASWNKICKLIQGTKQP